MPPRITREGLLLLQLVATAAMTGVIWFVQVVTYPQFAQIGADQFVAYHESYTRLVSWIVAPLMALELATAVGSVFLFRGTAAGRWLFGGLLLIISLWLMTALVQVPQHEQLSEGFDPEVAATLTAGNWWRTAGWSLRSILLVLVFLPLERGTGNPSPSGRH